MNCSGPTYTGPIYEYNHGAGCESITGGAFVPNNGSWPDSYDDVYLYGDFKCNKIFELRPAAGAASRRRSSRPWPAMVL